MNEGSCERHGRRRRAERACLNITRLDYSAVGVGWKESAPKDTRAFDNPIRILSDLAAFSTARESSRVRRSCKISAVTRPNEDLECKAHTILANKAVHNRNLERICNQRVRFLAGYSLYENDISMNMKKTSHRITKQTRSGNIQSFLKRYYSTERQYQTSPKNTER